MYPLSPQAVSPKGANDTEALGPEPRNMRFTGLRGFGGVLGGLGGLGV